MKTKKRYMPLPGGYRLNVNKFENFCRGLGMIFLSIATVGYILGGAWLLWAVVKLVS